MLPNASQPSATDHIPVLAEEEWMRGAQVVLQILDVFHSNRQPDERISDT